MKKIVHIALSTIIFPFITICQPCLPEGITFTTQNQIDSFQINYPNCTEIEGDVQIIGDDITNLYGLSDVTSISGALRIGSDPPIWAGTNLINLEGLENLTVLKGDLVIIANRKLTSLLGLDNLETIEGSLIIGTIVRPGVPIGNVKLSSLSALNNLNFIGGYIGIYGNNSLENLMGLNNLDTIPGGIWIWGNELSSLSGLDGVKFIGASLSLVAEDQLINLWGLDQVKSIIGHLVISNNYSLVNLSGLDNLTSIGSYLYIGLSNAQGISGNYSLTSLTGLDKLSSIGGSLTIGGNHPGNPSLTNLTGLNNIEAGSITDLTINYNTSLSGCMVQSICNYLLAPNGEIRIANNAPGCNSLEEVEEACDTLAVQEFHINNHLLVSPNPFSTSTTITYMLNRPSTVTISIFNPQGQLIEKIEQQQPKGEQQVQWNADGLPAGIYYFRIQTGDKAGGGKMVLMR